MMLKPIALIALLLISAPAFAANLDARVTLGDAPASVAPVQGNNAPVEITADKTLEWHKEDRQYIARVNAMVKKGNMTIKADIITADYHDDKKSGADIYRMTGTGHVIIDNAGNVATGDKVIYDLDTGLATMTGEALSMTSPEQTVTAKNKFEYVISDGQVRAIGDAKLVRGNDTLYGDTITAYLADDAQGNKSLSRMEAAGNVKIVTPNENLTGNKAVYNAQEDTAVITGNVKIIRDKNILTGERAEVNLTTNVSRLFGSSIEDGQTGGRVRGVFYPGNDKKKTAAPVAAESKDSGSVFTTVPEPAPAPVITTTSPEPAPLPKPETEKVVAPASSTKTGQPTTEHKQKASTPN